MRFSLLFLPTPVSFEAIGTEVSLWPRVRIWPQRRESLGYL